MRNGTIVRGIAMGRLIQNRICPLCQSAVRCAQGSVECSVCRTVHHTECWAEYEGCTTLGCSGTPVRRHAPKADGAGELRKGITAHVEAAKARNVTALLATMKARQAATAGEEARWVPEGTADRESRYLLGMALRTGSSEVRDPAEAAALFRSAAEQGHAEAQCELAIMYEKGIGVKRDRAEAARWYRAAASNGNARARKLLSIMGEPRAGRRDEEDEELLL